MKKDLTLLIMAAGMSSRFGGLKQIEPIGPTGEFIIDYSIYDAIKAGFNKVVFIIKEENLTIFKQTIGSRLKNKIKVEYVFQQIEDVPTKYKAIMRDKPWGTAHAIRAARNIIHEPFAVISADDFYGFDTFIKIAEFLKDNIQQEYGIIAYKALDTISKFGSVNRGILFQNNGILKQIVECTLEKIKDGYIAKPHNQTKPFFVNENTEVTMLTYGFTPDIFEFLDQQFASFLNNNNDLENAEFYIPDVIQALIKQNQKTIRVINTTSHWYGMTYLKDKLEVIQSLQLYIEKKEYPLNLWK